MPNYAKWLLKLAFTIAILGAILAKADFGQFFATLPLIAPVSILVGLMLALLQSGAAAARLSLIISLYNRRLPLWDSLRVTLESAFFSQTFVSFLGGDALRIWRIRRCGLPLSQAASAVVLDRLIGVLINHVFLLVALPWLLVEIPDHAIRVGLVVLASAGVAGFAFLLFLGAYYGNTGPASSFPNKIGTTRIGRLFREMAAVGSQFLRPNIKLLMAVAASVLIALINSLIFFVLLVGWGMTTGVAFGCALLIPAVMEIAMLPISIAGWGVREGVAIIAFSAFGIPSAIALGSSVLFGLIVLAVGLVGGLLWLVDHREIGTLAAIEAEVSEVAASTTNA